MPRRPRSPISILSTAVALVGLALLVGCGGGDVVTADDVRQQAEEAGVDCNHAHADSLRASEEQVERCTSYIRKVCGKGGEASEEFCRKAAFVIRDNTGYLEIEQASAQMDKEEKEEALDTEPSGLPSCTEAGPPCEIPGGGTLHYAP